VPHKSHQHAPTQRGRTVLVLGATGKQGGAVASALKDRGWTVRALVRNPDSDAAKNLGSAGVDVLRGDFLDVGAVRSAMAGVYGVFSVQPNSGSAGSGVTNADEVRFGKTVADLAVEAGVRHLVYTSAGIISKGRTGLENLDCKIEIENHIRGLSIASTIVRPATFMDLFVLPGMGLDQGMFSFFMRPDQPIQVIAVEDIGKIVATIFEETDRFAGCTVEIAGDEVTGFDLQKILSEAAGRPIRYHRFPDTLLENNAFLRDNAALFEEGRATGNADIAEVRGKFGDLLSLKAWLAGAGKRPLHAALAADAQPVALR
jgi:uncharacterized protein YbjT (DUF2867 family)